MSARIKRQFSLKVSSKFFEPVKEGLQKFLIRFEDQEFKVGDIVTLQEYRYNSSKKLEASGETITRQITVTLRGCKGLDRGYVALGLEEDTL